MKPDAIFVVLSDMHFGADLLSEANGTLLDVPFWLRFVDSDVKRFFDTRCAAHDLAILKSLPRYLKQLLLEYRKAGFPGEAFDMCLLLGDQATVPTGSAYQFLREYLTSNSYRTGDSELMHICSGLNISPNKLVAIPGNHDKLLHKDLDVYQDEFLKALGLRPEPRKQVSACASAPSA